MAPLQLLCWINYRTVAYVVYCDDDNIDNSLHWLCHCCQDISKAGLHNLNLWPCSRMQPSIKMCGAVNVQF